MSPPSYRLLVIIRQNRQVSAARAALVMLAILIAVGHEQVPQIVARQSGLGDAFLANPRFSLDVVYWHVNDSIEQTQVLLRTIDRLLSVACGTQGSDCALQTAGRVRPALRLR